MGKLSPVTISLRTTTYTIVQQLIQSGQFSTERAAFAYVFCKASAHRATGFCHLYSFEQAYQAFRDFKRHYRQHLLDDHNARENDDPFAEFL